MKLDAEIVQWGISGALAAGITIGIIKGKMYNYITYDRHREICDKERAETNRHLDNLYNGQKEMHGMIKEIHGYIKAKNGGSI